MKIELISINTTDGKELISYKPVNDNFLINIEIWIKIIQKQEESTELYTSTIFSPLGLLKELDKTKSLIENETNEIKSIFLPKGIICFTYSYDDIYNKIKNYIESINPKNIGELFLLMDKLFEYNDSLFNNRIQEIKHYIGKAK